MITQKVALSGVRFFSPIGYYEEEQIVGNEFFVAVEAYFPFQNEDTEHLGNTINYEDIYQILVEVMGCKRKLLESAAQEILDKVLKKYGFLTKLSVNIRKVNPAFGGDLANSEVALIWEK